VKVSYVVVQAAGGIVASQTRDSGDSSGGGGRGIVYRLIERVSSQVPAIFRRKPPVGLLSALSQSFLSVSNSV
jgi:hypothetical protein